MQDYSIHDLNCLASVLDRSWEQELIDGIKEEDFVSSPEKMYGLSLRIKARLPDRLHESMLMWAFDPAQSAYVKMYLEWVEHCGVMKTYRARIERTMRNHERMLFFAMIASGVVLASLLFLNFVK